MYWNAINVNTLRHISLYPVSYEQSMDFTIQKICSNYRITTSMAGGQMLRFLTQCFHNSSRFELSQDSKAAADSTANRVRWEYYVAIPKTTYTIDGVYQSQIQVQRLVFIRPRLKANLTSNGFFASTHEANGRLKRLKYA